MKAGRELDALIAEKVMGWRRFGTTLTLSWRTPEGIVTWEESSYPSFRPSERIQDAWLVVEKMQSDGWSAMVVTHAADDNLCEFWKLHNLKAPICVNHQASPSLAICLAALEAVKDKP